MTLTTIKDSGAAIDETGFRIMEDFRRVLGGMTAEELAGIRAEINRRLDQILENPTANWGSITNTSIEGGKMNEETGRAGDWTGTPFGPIYRAAGQSHQQSAFFYGNMWKWVIIERPERWIGVRFDPTFPQRGITLQGKTYFPDRGR